MKLTYTYIKFSNAAYLWNNFTMYRHQIKIRHSISKPASNSQMRFDKSRRVIRLILHFQSCAIGRNIAQRSYFPGSFDHNAECFATRPAQIKAKVSLSVFGFHCTQIFTLSHKGKLNFPLWQPSRRIIGKCAWRVAYVTFPGIAVVRRRQRFKWRFSGRPTFAIVSCYDRVKLTINKNIKKSNTIETTQ